MVFTDAVRPSPSPSPSPSASPFLAPSPSPSPSKTLAAIIPVTPSRKESRRRTWFGLVTPTRNKDKARVASAATVPNIPSAPGQDNNSIEELEPTPPRAESKRRPWALGSSSGSASGSGISVISGPLGVARASSRASHTTASHSSAGTPTTGTTTSAGARVSESISTAETDDVDSDDDWVLAGSDNDSDWEATGTVRRKGTLRRPQIDRNQFAPQGGLDDDTPVRQKDLTTLAILSRNNTVKPKPFKSRLFSRASNEAEFTAATPEPSSTPPTIPPLALTPSNLPRRVSSMSRTPVSDADARFFDKSPIHKPLPLLPQHDDFYQPRSVSLPLHIPNGAHGAKAPHQDGAPSAPVPPANIVVTPCSPVNQDPVEVPFGNTPVNRPFSCPPDSPQQRLFMPRVQQAGSGSPSPAGKTQSIGLGLPEGHPRRFSALPNIPSNKPLPAIVSVSSPLPSGARSPTPGNKVSFATKQGSHDYEAKEKEPSDKVKAPRPRSISAMFSRSPLLNADQTDDEESGSSKFNWLGVRKTIKRRRSESKMNQQRKSVIPMTGEEAESTADESQSKPTNISTPMLISEPRGRPASSSTTATARPTIPNPEVETPSSVTSFVLPPMEQEEWWPAREWAETQPEPEQQPTADDKEEAVDTSAEQASSKDTHSSSRRAPPSRSSSLLSSTVGSGLGSLPEGGLAPSATPSVPPIEEQPATVSELPRRDHSRRRSYSDAGRRSYRPTVDSPLAQSPTSSPRSMQTNFLATLAGETPRSPKLPRPKSSNSALVKMRSVFTLNGRARSNSAMRYGSDDGRETPHTRPASSASAGSSFIPSPALPPIRIRPEDVPQVSQLQLMIGGDDPQRPIVITETPEMSPRSSYAASLGSRNSVRRSSTADPHATTQAQSGGLRPARARASTISSGAISFAGTFGITTHSNHSTTGTFGGHIPHTTSAQSLHGVLIGQSGSTTHLPLPAPTFPTAATPPRRPGSIRRLSTGLFRAASPKPHDARPISPRPISGAVPVPDDFSPRDSTNSQSRSGSVIGMATVGDRGLDKKDVDTTVHEDDTTETWLGRVLLISRRQLSTILAESSDKFHMDALCSYMSRFDFYHTALDVALRRLLMDLSLPKETQQIDRVVEAFATRYEQCEPGLFGSKDNTYVLAFSMMMLHTDAFNRHNKNKMTKADYVRNTRLDGVPETTLEAFYDNITFTPFVFIEDDNEASLAAVGASTVANGPVRPGKVDVYDMIASGTIMTLRANVESLIPAESPFSCMGTRAFLDVDSLQRRFADAHPLSFIKSRPRRKSSVTMPSLAGSHPDKTPSKPVPKEEIQTLKITKVGLITRKDDSLLPNGKRPTGRKWKNWNVILTGSQLLFFKDTILALTLMEQIRNSGRHDPDQPVIPRMTNFQPDEVFSVKECVAVWDREYTEMPFTFRFIMPAGRQYLMQALDEVEMNEWLTLINYASTFKSAGIRMRAQAIDSGEAVLAGTAAAESHRKDLATANGGMLTPPEAPAARTVLFSDTTTVDDAPPPTRPMLRRVGSLRATPTPKVDIQGANDIVTGGGEQIEAVIGSVKAELAAGRGTTATTRPVSMQPRSQSVPIYKSLRTETIQERLRSLRDMAGVIEKRLASNLRIGRNLALLTPFQKVTRDRIEAAVPELAQLIRNDRIDLAKLHLWISMLLKDQERDEREWARVRHVALQAAAKSLRNGLTVMDRRATLAHPIAIPKLSLPSDEGWNIGDPTPDCISPTSPGLMSPPNVSRGSSGSGSELPTISRNSAVSGSSDVSAVDQDEPLSSKRTSSGSGCSEYELASEYLSASSVLSLHEELVQQLGAAVPDLTLGRNGLGSAGGSLNGSASGHRSPRSPDGSTAARSPLGDERDIEQLHDTAEEEAEHWRNTRAATKVSLARLPRGVGEIQSRIENWI